MYGASSMGRTEKDMNWFTNLLQMIPNHPKTLPIKTMLPTRQEDGTTTYNRFLRLMPICGCQEEHRRQVYGVIGLHLRSIHVSLLTVPTDSTENTNRHFTDLIFRHLQSLLMQVPIYCLHLLLHNPLGRLLSQ